MKLLQLETEFTEAFSVLLALKWTDRMKTQGKLFKIVV